MRRLLAWLFGPHRWRYDDYRYNRWCTRCERQETRLWYATEWKPVTQGDEKCKNL